MPFHLVLRAGFWQAWSLVSFLSYQSHTHYFKSSYKGNFFIFVQSYSYHLKSSDRGSSFLFKSCVSVPAEDFCDRFHYFLNLVQLKWRTNCLFLLLHQEFSSPLHLEQFYTQPSPLLLGQLSSSPLHLRQNILLQVILLVGERT